MLVGYKELGSRAASSSHITWQSALAAWRFSGPVADAHGVYGIGLSQTREDTSDYDPENIATAWLTVDWNSR